MKPNYILHAEALLGEHEISGRLDNKKIVELYKDAGHPEIEHDETPWCAAFVGACLARANIKPTGTLLARDYATYGIKLNKPQMYCIGVMKRGGSGWEGHVGFVVKWDDTHIWMLGGNQHDGVNVSQFPRDKFIAFRMPTQVEDKPVKEIVKDSRRLKTQNWFQRILVGLGLGGTLTWDTLNNVKSFANDHVGMLILGGIGVTWIVLEVLKRMSIREYKQGRYQPSKQWL